MLLNDAVAALCEWGPAAKVSPEIRLANRHPTLSEEAIRQCVESARKACLFAYQRFVEMVDAKPESTNAVWHQFETSVGNTFPWLTHRSLRRLFFQASYGAYKDGILSGPLTAPHRSVLQWIKDAVK
ncbi:MAG: hypothetical protein JNL19_07285 [Burkholderiales bacterium]|nr:hypothetical protein [Burkholderiales bacterium]